MDAPAAAVHPAAVVTDDESKQAMAAMSGPAVAESGLNTPLAGPPTAKPLKPQHAIALGHIEALQLCLTGVKDAVSGSARLSREAIIAHSDVVTKALTAFQQCSVYSGRNKNAIIKINRSFGVYTTSQRLRSTLVRSDLFPVLVGPCNALADTTAVVLVALCSQLAVYREFQCMELLCYTVLSTVIVSSKQVDEIVGYHGLSIAALAFVGTNALPVAKTPATDGMQSLATRGDGSSDAAVGDEDVDVTDATDAGAASPSDTRLAAWQTLTRTCRQKLDCASLPSLVSDVLRLLDDATRAGGDGAAGVLKQMESSLSGVLRCVFAYTVLPWPRLSADAWVSVCARL